MKSRFDTGAEESPSSSEGYTSESDAQALRALSEEIARDFAPRLDRTTLVLYDRDPEHLQAQWYVTPESLAEARSLFPGDRKGSRQVLRLCRLDREGRTEVVASASQESGESTGVEQYGFDLQGDGAEYLCELGLVSDEGGWLLLARSNWVRLAGRNPSELPRIASVPDDAPTRSASRATTEPPEENTDMPVETALAAVGEPLYPVFPNLEQDDPTPPGPSAPPEEALGRARPQDRQADYPPGIPPYPAPYLKLDDVLPERSESPEEMPNRARSQDREPEYPPGVPPYLVSYRESGDAPEYSTPPAETPRQEAPGQAGSRDRKPEFPPGIPDYLRTVAEIPSEVSVEAALAAVGEPLYPVFPNLELDDAPLPGSSTSLKKVSQKPLSRSGEGLGRGGQRAKINTFCDTLLEEEVSRAWAQDRRPESPPSTPPYLAPYLETATDLPPGADPVAMPPLLPSSPGLDTGTDTMPGPLYDPRAALSSAALSPAAGVRHGGPRGADRSGTRRSRLQRRSVQAPDPGRRGRTFLHPPSDCHLGAGVPRHRQGPAAVEGCGECLPCRDLFARRRCVCPTPVAHAVLAEAHQQRLADQGPAGAGLVEHPCATLTRWWGGHPLLVSGCATVRGEMSRMVLGGNVLRGMPILGVGAFRDSCTRRPRVRPAEAVTQLAGWGVTSSLYWLFYVLPCVTWWSMLSGPDDADDAP